ncbi:MAG: FtsX-like permease family protein [Propionibacteriaceae bacterium]|jgi:putative ABC transport system permease protein|nr:FtsX-like permease family protein [Propionibacteriaceae bacterium]
MLVIINAVKAITRSKGRNILIMLIVAVIAAASAVALSIRHAASEAETSGQSDLTITGAIGLDRQKLMESAQAGQSTDGATQDPAASMDSMRELMQQYPDLTLDQLQTYADSSYVADFLYSASLSLDTTGDVEAVSDQASSDTTDSAEDPSATESSDPSMPSGQDPQRGGFAGGGPTMFGGRSMGDLTVIGYGSEASMTSFVDGTNQISDGSMIDLTQADNACLVSDEFASFNSLAVGDTITLANPAADTETYTLTIAGIYQSDSSSTSGSDIPMFSTSQDSANQVIVSYPTVSSIETSSASVATDTTDSQGDTVSTALSASTSGDYVFASPADYNAFDAELTAKGLDSAYTLSSSDLENYEASLVPLQNLSSFAQTLLWIVLGVGAVVLVTIAIFSIRERKYEVGVLTAIGVAKPKVALQFVVEMFLVAVLGLLVGLGVGAAVSPPIASSLLSAQVAQQESQSQSVDQNFGRVNIQGGPPAAQGGGPSGGGFGQAVDYINQINATLDWSVISQLAAIGLGLAVLASAAGVVFVMRYDPLTILSNRS